MKVAEIEQISLYHQNYDSVTRDTHRRSVEHCTMDYCFAFFCVLVRYLAHTVTDDHAFLSCCDLLSFLP